jgi:hypothetical protein
MASRLLPVHAEVELIFVEVWRQRQAEVMEGEIAQ